MQFLTFLEFVGYRFAMQWFQIVTHGELNEALADDTVSLPATLQSVDDKLNSIVKLLQSNTNSIREMKTEQKELGTSIDLFHSNISEGLN